MFTWEEHEINGSDNLSEIQTYVGIKHRLRLMHIAPSGRIRLRMEKEGEPVPVRIIAKDGADLPEAQRVMVESSFRYGVGESADFEFLPQEPGNYQLYIWNRKEDEYWMQEWVVGEE